MKAVMASMLPDVAAFRKKTGADRWDEMWEGVLHTAPTPNRDHQKLEWAMETWIQFHWAQPGAASVVHNINVASVGGWPNDYKIPDLVLVGADRLSIDKNEYFEGAPTVVVEIRSPDDETYDKMPWYAALGVPEVWVVDRDMKLPELYELQGDTYIPVATNTEGWLVSKATNIELKSAEAGRLLMRLAGDDRTLDTLPLSRFQAT